MKDLYDHVHLLKRAGDVLRLLATVTLLLVMWNSRKSTGLSGKSQLLYAIVYTSRYLSEYLGKAVVSDAFEIAMRITLVLSSYLTVYLIYNKFRYDSSRKEDSFRLVYLLIPCAILALVYNPSFSRNFFVYDELLVIEFPFIHVSWAFSYYLESVAILPQLLMLHSHKVYDKQNFVAGYLLIMGLSRVMYTVHSIWERNHDLITHLTGIVQFCIYLGYFLLQFNADQTKPNRNEVHSLDV